MDLQISVYKAALMSEDSSKVEINMPEWYQHSNPHRDIRFLYLGGSEIDHQRFQKLLALMTVPESVQLTSLFCNDTDQVIDELLKGWGYVLVFDAKLSATAERKMSEEEYLHLIEVPNILRHFPHLQILILSESCNVVDVVHTANFGAANFLSKVQDDRSLGGALLMAAYLSSRRLDYFLSHLEHLQNHTEVKLVGKSFAVRHLKKRLENVAIPDGPILLLGATGTGKTKAAEYIHELRYHYDPSRKNMRFVGLNMAAISPEIIESELFGHEAGAFTGAKDRHIGFFEKANGGTLFLDEIGEASLSLQSKILKAIDEKKFHRLGGGEVKSSFKLICATNKDLSKMVKENTFREDLYMRIATYEIAVPSLNERKEDIPDIIQQLLPRVCEESGIYVPFEDLPLDFIKYLAENPGEGNFRGIRINLIRLLTYAPKDRVGRPVLKGWRNILNPSTTRSSDVARSLTLKTLDIPFDLIGPDFPGLKAILRLVESKILMEAKKKFKKNIDIAKVLKIDPATVSRRLQTIKI